MSTENPLFILYGSATGNAESIAKDLAARYQNDSSLLPFPFTSVICCEGNKFKKTCLPIWEKGPPSCEKSNKYGVIVVMSTTGNGDAPENGARFVRYIKKKPTIESKPMKHVAYGVLALGDTNYDKFCASGQLVDKKLLECGGERVRKISMADEGTGNMEVVVEEFLENIVNELADYCLNSNGESNSDSTYGISQSKEEEKKESGVEEGGEEGGEEVKINGTSIGHKLNKSDENPAGPPPKNTQNNVTIRTNENGQSTSKKDLLSYTGVSLIQHLLSANKSGGEETIPTVDSKSLPTMGSASLAKCEVLPSDFNPDDTSNTLTAEIDRMTVSSASSSNIHYTLNHPYESTILSARYLTKSNLDGVKKASNALNSDGENNNNNACLDKLQNAASDIQAEFPINITERNGLIDSKILDQNGKRVIELKLGLPEDFTLEYQPGDSIGFVPSNKTSASQFVLSLLRKHHNIHPTQYIHISGQPVMTVKDLVCDYLDLCSPIKNKRLLVSLANHAKDDNEKKALDFLASSEPSSQMLFNTLIDEQRISVVDILRLFPSCQSISLEQLGAVLPRIPPRYYSICSSPLKKENEQPSLTIAFSVVDYMTPQLPIIGMPQRRVGGLVTTYLETICSTMICNDNTSKHTFEIPKVKIFPKPTADFRLPSSLSTPMILIGPGTGIAPFIGFLEHRQAQIAAKKCAASNSVTEGTWRGGFYMEEEQADPIPHEKRIHGDIDLYFGCRYSEHDWLYEDEMKSFLSSNILNSLEVAFSRDDAKKKCYVQDKIEENSSRLASMVLNENATIFICGDGNAMAKDVQSGIQRALDSYTSSEDKVENITIEQLKQSGRLLIDIWS